MNFGIRNFFDLKKCRARSEITGCSPRFPGDSGRSRSTKEASQPSVRTKVGATLVPGRNQSESI